MNDPNTMTNVVPSAMPDPMNDLRIQRVTTPKQKPPAGELGFGQHFSDHMFLMEYDPKRAWHTPRIVPYGPLSVDPAASVFHYGQALFEGLKAFRGQDGKVRLFQVARHCDRMRGSAQRLSIPALPPELALQTIQAFTRVEKEWVPSAPGTSLYLRPAIIGTEGFLGVRAATRYTYFIIASPVGAYYAEGLNPIRLWVEEHYIRAARGGVGAAKAGANYVASLMAAEEAKRRGYAQVLWLDAEHHQFIEEAGTMNACVVIDGELCTPPLEGSILPGVTRACVLSLAREWGLRASERRVSMDEVLSAHSRGTLQEIFGCGTASVIAPVGELGYRDQQIVINGGRIGPLSQRLYKEITDIQYGRIPDRHGWLSPVD